LGKVETLQTLLEGKFPEDLKELFFTLRGVNMDDLIGQVARKETQKPAKRTRKVVTKEKSPTPKAEIKSKIKPKTKKKPTSKT
jgi:uncharacterized Zn finger protein